MHIIAVDDEALLLDLAEREIRKAEQRTATDKTSLFRGRRLFMIPQAKLSAEQSGKLAQMSKKYPKTGRAYRIVAGLDDFGLSGPADAVAEKLGMTVPAIMAKIEKAGW